MWRASQLIGLYVHATDGEIGSVADLLFDDKSWIMRWVVIDTGSWLPGRKVIVPPAQFGAPDLTRRELPARLTREQIERSPGLETHEPVSRQKETVATAYYGGRPYWYTGDLTPGGPAIPAVPPPGPRAAPPSEARAEGDPHLRSAGEVTGYYVQASDGEIGHVEDILVDPESWAIRYMLVDTKNWLPGKMALVSPEWLGDVSWSRQELSVKMTRAQVENSPEYDPSTTPDRAYEERLHGYYGYNPYWGRM